MRRTWFLLLLAAILFLFSTSSSSITPLLQAENTGPPDQTVKLIFIHHSTGENLLIDDYGGLGLALAQNHYFVSDTNYGWGPEAIGDRTDIPNWLEWFRSEDTDRYMQALFNESGQNSDYTRPLADPGGENQVILFKSCFPNSNLEGNPNDLPSPGSDFSVGNAKYIYNELLKYFITRPDKLFVVITAPPVTDPTYAQNARAFNLWLMNDWLRENAYPYLNVAVFDFYNVLTGPDAHHRLHNGQVEHILGDQNTSYYASSPEDDHPSVDGSRKATEEFVPLLNLFYRRWASSAPSQPLIQTQTTDEIPQTIMPAPTIETLPTSPALPASGFLIDDFEIEATSGSNGWEGFWDEATTTTITCAPANGESYNGNRSLPIDFDVVANSWATCTLFYENLQDWSTARGLVFYLRASQAGLVFNLDLYAGTPEEQETYLYTIEAPPDSMEDWIPVELRWEEFHRADWETNAGAPFVGPDRISGLAFGFNTYPDTPNTGTIWVDDIQLLVDAGAGNLGQTTVTPTTANETAEASEGFTDVAGEAGEPAGSGGGLCSSSITAPLLMVVGVLWLRKRRTMD